MADYSKLKSKLAYYKANYKKEKRKLMRQWQKIDSRLCGSEDDEEELEQMSNSTGSSGPGLVLGIDFDAKVNRIIEAEADKITQILLGGTPVNLATHNDSAKSNVN